MAATGRQRAGACVSRTDDARLGGLADAVGHIAVHLGDDLERLAAADTLEDHGVVVLRHDEQQVLLLVLRERHRGVTRRQRADNTITRRLATPDRGQSIAEITYVGVVIHQDCECYILFNVHGLALIKLKTQILGEGALWTHELLTQGLNSFMTAIRP